MTNKNTENVSIFFCHNARTRASMALMHDKVSGLVLLATAFANLKPNKDGKRDVYNKRMARILMSGNVDRYLRDLQTLNRVPLQALHPNVMLIGFYDGDKSKNDLFGPLIDFFHTMSERRNVDHERMMLHSTAQELLTIANHRIGSEHRKQVKKDDEFVRDIIGRLKNDIERSVIDSPAHMGALNLLGLGVV